MTETTVTVTRVKQYATSGRNVRFAWKWLYSYRVNDGPTITYGTHLASLRDQLKRKHGSAAVIAETWKG